MYNKRNMCINIYLKTFIKILYRSHMFSQIYKKKNEWCKIIYFNTYNNSKIKKELCSVACKQFSGLINNHL